MPFWATLGKAFGITSPWGIVAWGATIGANLLLSKYLRPKQKIDRRRESTPRDEDIKRRWIMGKQRRVSGKLCFASIVPPTDAANALGGEGYKKNHLRLIYVLSEGPIGDIKGVYLDDSKHVPMEKTGNVLTPKYGYRISTYERNLAQRPTFPQTHVIELKQFFAADGASQSSIQITAPSDRRYYNQVPNDQNPETYTGSGSWEGSPNYSANLYTDDQTSTPPANTQVPFDQEYKVWDSSHKLTGVSYVSVELFQPFHQEDDPNDDYWKTIPKIEFVVGGLKFNTPNSPTTKVESENPIDQLYWYDTEVLKIPAANIDRTAYNEARAVCEEEVSFTNTQLTPEFSGWLGTYKTFKKYTANHIIEEGESKDAVHARLLASCAGYRFEFGGKVFYRAGKERSSVLTLGEDEIEDIVEVKPWPALSERYNQITAEISQNRALGYKSSSYVFKDDAAFMRDSELRNIDVNLECVDHPLSAGYLLAVLTRQQRQSFTFSAVIPPLENMDQLKKLLPGNKVTITKSELGFTNRECIVQSVNVRNDFRVVVVLKLNIAGIYANTLILPPIRPRGLAFNPSAIPEAPTNLTTDEIAHINKDGTVVVRLDAIWDRTDAITTEVQARIKTPQGEWQPFVTNQNGTKASLHGVEIGKTYEIRARHISKDNVPSVWVNATDNTIDGDLTPPSPITDVEVTSLPQGINVKWENPTDNDFAAACVFISEQQNFMADENTLVATLSSNVFESGGYTAGTTYYIKLKPKDTSGNLGPETAELSTVPTVSAAEGIMIHSGVGQPSNSLGDDGDLYLELNDNMGMGNAGALWKKESGVWSNTGIDLAKAGAILIPFNIEDTEDTPMPEPNVTAPVGSLAFNTFNGQYWERLSSNTWMFRGDLTGKPGKNARGWVPWLGSVVATVGVDGDYTVNPTTGEWYIRQSGSWVKQGDLTGSDGSRWFTYSGSAQPSSTTFGSQTARVGDFALSTTTNRYYELTGASTWTLRGDLGAEVEGSKIVFFTAGLGINPSVHIAEHQANVGDEAINTRTAEFWEKTATPNTWALRGDLGKRVTTLTTEDPPSTNGERIGDIAISNVDTNNRKLYVWQIKGTDTNPSWVLKGVLRGPGLSVDDSVPENSITGDIYWDENGDISIRNEEGEEDFKRTTNQPPVSQSDEVDPETNPVGCTVWHSATWPPSSSLGANGDAAYSGRRWGRKVNGSWVEQTPSLSTSTTNYIWRREELPTINFNTAGWRALNPASSRTPIIVIIMSTTEAWNYNYDSDSWTKIAKMCSTAPSTVSAPSNFRRTSLTYPSNTSATAALAWNPVSDATGYSLRVVPARSAGSSTFSRTSSQTTLSITGLSRGTSYSVYLKTLKGTASSAETSVTFTTTGSPPTIQAPYTPISVTATPSTSTQGSVSVAFRAATPSSTRPISKSVVTLYRNNVAVTGKSKDVSYTTGTNNYTATFTGLAIGTGYTARVYHNNSAGNGSYRSSSSFSITSLTPTLPTTLSPITNLRLNLTFNHDDTEDIYATWSSVTGATTYAYSATPSSAFASGEMLTGNVTIRAVRLQLSSTADGTKVTFSLRAKSATAQSSLTSGEITVNIDNLASDSNGSGARAIAGLRITVRGGSHLGSFQFNSTSNTVNLTGYQYRIQRKRGSGSFVNIAPVGLSSDWYTVNRTSGSAVSVGLSNTIFSGHQASDVYLFRARRVYSDGNGPESSVSFRIQD